MILLEFSYFLFSLSNSHLVFCLCFKVNLCLLKSEIFEHWKLQSLQIYSCADFGNDFGNVAIKLNAELVFKLGFKISICCCSFVHASTESLQL